MIKIELGLSSNEILCLYSIDLHSTICRAVKTCVKDIFREGFDAVFEHLANGGKGSGKVTEEDLRSLLFGDFLRPDLEVEERFYEEVKVIDTMY